MRKNNIYYMQKFEEWLIENHPELLDENWRSARNVRNVVGALTLAAAPWLSSAGDVKAQQLRGGDTPKLTAQHVSPNYEQATTLREMHDLLKSDYERSDIVLAVYQLKKIAPEYYQNLKIRDMASMPDNAYKEFLENLDHNAREQEAFQNMPFTKLTDQYGTIEIEAKFLRFDLSGTPNGSKTGSVWIQTKDGNKRRLPYEWLSVKSQKEIDNIVKLWKSVK